MQVNTTINAGSSIEFQELADFFRVLTAQSTVDLTFYSNGARVASASSVGAGYAEKFSQPFDKVVITSAVTQTIQLVARLGNEVRYDNLTGNVAITNVNGAFTQSQKTVTNASAQLAASNAIRRYMLIQNNDSAGDIYVRVDGATATATTGIKIRPGGSYELQGFVASGSITAIGSIASNANIVMIEG